MMATTEYDEPVACYSTGGRWSPNENRPMHATMDGGRSLCGVDNVEVFASRDGRTGSRSPIPFSDTAHKCMRCERSLAKGDQ